MTTPSYETLLHEVGHIVKLRFKTLKLAHTVPIATPHAESGNKDKI